MVRGATPPAQRIIQKEKKYYSRRMLSPSVELFFSFLAHGNLISSVQRDMIHECIIIGIGFIVSYYNRPCNAKGQGFPRGLLLHFSCLMCVLCCCIRQQPETMPGLAIIHHYIQVKHSPLRVHSTGGR